jgi:protease-4
MRESIFIASIRSFFIALFGIAGLLLGIILIIAIIGSISGTADGEPNINYTYTPQIVPNAAGIRKSLSSDAPIILKLNVNGVIGIEPLTRQDVDQQLTESRERTFKNDRVKAVLLYIDSPGGTAVDADGIYHAVKAYKEKHKVPVYAFVDGLCASGGMYVACAADKIFASQVSIVGSVGVIMPSVLNFSQLLDKVGVQSITLYDGKGKDNLNPLRPWRKGEEDNMKDIIAYYYANFVDIVASNRPSIDKTKLINDYGANIYPASTAKDYGYIDQSGYSLDRALKELAEAIGIQDDYYQVVEFENKSWFSQLFGGSTTLFSGRVTHRLELTPDLDPKLMNQYLYLYRP